MNVYITDEIKYKIDTAIQVAMFYSDEPEHNSILDVQTRLYEEFGIED